MSNIIVAVDGPAASGKSSVSRRCAKELSFCYVDSGSLYRGVTWQALAQGVACQDSAAVATLLNSLSVEFAVEDDAVYFKMNGEAPGDAIRSAEVNDNVSYVATVPEVRHSVVEWLREMAALGSLVMEGRDIGTNVFPAANMKFYLDASPEVRAQRRTGEFKGEVSQQDVAVNLKKRDKIDSSRKTHPLAVADDAEVVDTTYMSLDDVVHHIVERVRSGC